MIVRLRAGAPSAHLAYAFAILAARRVATAQLASSAAGSDREKIVRMNAPEDLRASWTTAVLDLGIDVEELDGVLLVRDFGAKNGTLCASSSNTAAEIERLKLAARRRGSFWSALGTDYLTYNRELFVATLDDWGWFGSGSSPSWYTGAVWGEARASDMKV
jgi:hypothetical protein